MTDSYSDPQRQERHGDGHREGGKGEFRGGRGSGNRDAGGFRIRLSDNEMRSARALQEAFQLRSTVAVLGFALRALGQMLEDGQLDELIAKERSKAPRTDRRREDGNQRNRSDRSNPERQSTNRGAKPDPFARPAKPQPQAQEQEQVAPENEQSNAAEPVQETELEKETPASTPTDLEAEDNTASED
ncbi:MAG: hypothetical protein QGH52_03985 [Prochlorococcaceae cyanobacterium ETNP1_MAG_8]|nr:hypothetical protein [Prochlorococcaceae cyanobacterium ETNP1_MAG_8]